MKVKASQYFFFKRATPEITKSHVVNFHPMNIVKKNHYEIACDTIWLTMAVFNVNLFPMTTFQETIPIA